MKRLFLVLLATLFLTTTASAWTLRWDAVTGVDGYKLFWKGLSATTFTEVDAGMTATYDLDLLELAVGSRYEFYIIAHSKGSVSAESDHLRWTVPVEPVIIELPDTPERLIIEF